MMFERFTEPVRAVVVDAQLHARRLGHGYLGCEHLLLAVASSDQPAGKILRDAGVTPSAVEAVMLRLVGGPPGALDRDALAAIGIDLDVIRAKVEPIFGPNALIPRARPSRRRWRRRRSCDAGPNYSHLPFTPRAKKCLQLSLREASELHSSHIGVEHLALALTATTDGLAPQILSAIGVVPVQLRVAILNRHRQAS